MTNGDHRSPKTHSDSAVTRGSTAQGRTVTYPASGHDVVQRKWPEGPQPQDVLQVPGGPPEPQPSLSEQAAPWTQPEGVPASMQTTPSAVPRQLEHFWHSRKPLAAQSQSAHAFVPAKSVAQLAPG